MRSVVEPLGSLSLLTTAIGAAIGIFAMIRMVLSSMRSKHRIEREIFWSTFATLFFYTAVLVSNFVAFLMHIVNDTYFQDYTTNPTYSGIIDNVYGSCYILSMVSMLFVFVFRLKIVFEKSVYRISVSTMRVYYGIIIIIAVLGLAGSVFDILRSVILLYIVAGTYISLLYGFSFYLLQKFINQLKIFTENVENITGDYLRSMHVTIVKLNVIARCAIISTFILTIIGSCVDMFGIFYKDRINNKDDKKYFENNGEFLTRFCFAIDSIVGIICMSFTMSSNDRIYIKLCHCFHRKLMKKHEIDWKKNVCKTTKTTTTSKTTIATTTTETTTTTNTTNTAKAVLTLQNTTTNTITNTITNTMTSQETNDSSINKLSDHNLRQPSTGNESCGGGGGGNRQNWNEKGLLSVKRIEFQRTNSESPASAPLSMTIFQPSDTASADDSNDPDTDT